MLWPCIWIKSSIAFSIVTLYILYICKMDSNYLNYYHIHHFTLNFCILEMYCILAMVYLKVQSSQHCWKGAKTAGILMFTHRVVNNYRASSMLYAITLKMNIIPLCVLILKKPPKYIRSKKVQDCIMVVQKRWKIIYIYIATFIHIKFLYKMCIIQIYMECI